MARQVHKVKPPTRWAIVFVVGGVLLVAVMGNLRPANEAANYRAPLASPNDIAGSAPEQTDRAMRQSNGASADRDSPVASVSQTLPPVVFDFPDADLRLVEPAIIEAFFAWHPKGRFRVVTVNGDEIREVIRDKLRGIDRLVSIPFFPDTVVLATTSQAKETLSLGIATWRGKEVGSTSATMALSVGPDGVMSGQFVTSKGMYGIDVTTRPPFHIIWQWPPEMKEGPY